MSTSMPVSGVCSGLRTVTAVAPRSTVQPISASTSSSFQSACSESLGTPSTRTEPPAIAAAQNG